MMWRRARVIWQRDYLCGEWPVRFCGVDYISGIFGVPCALNTCIHIRFVLDNIFGYNLALQSLLVRDRRIRRFSSCSGSKPGYIFSFIYPELEARFKGFQFRDCLNRSQLIGPSVRLIAFSLVQTLKVDRNKDLRWRLSQYFVVSFDD